MGSGTSTDLLGALARFVQLLPIDAAAVCTLAAPFAVETLAATSRSAAVLDRAQARARQGPAWDASLGNLAVLPPLDAEEQLARWPHLAPALLANGLCALTALPVSYGPLDIGAVTLSSRTPLDPPDLDLAEHLATLLARAVLAAAAEGEIRVARSEHLLTDRKVWSAAAFLARASGLSPLEALLVLRGHAVRAGRSVRDVGGGPFERKGA
ncbi:MULTISPECIES: hypothetical protein [unclassified Rathayibacter]|uniref:hypothetical protein n=1 Tax=unclassified Rathayibacter TaxID=2609250 RepID=UPI00188D0C6B|nr:MULTISPECIES: hypothetical protein [unclassified Rathayibacter]MBF4461156.1 hypothetical protein [Rathayibacter sp. VKM Ac-2879]MBF4502567.1 hypothetical protein [Rathayibacter sp. VKM Ac-2878]